MLIVKIPGINGLGKTDGCEKAGNAVIAATKDIHTNEQGIPINTQLFNLEEIHLDNKNIFEANKLIFKNSLEFFRQEPKTILLGGDHSISFSTVKAFFEYCKKSGKDPCLIVFDAHADCMPPMKEPTHEEWLRALVDYGFPAENILLVGVRNLDPSETVFLKKTGIKVMKINHLLENFEDSCDIIMEFSKGKELYLSIDIDIIDPCFAPGTGYIEPGGLTSRQFIYLIQRINKLKNLKAIDIVEINPKKDRGNMTVRLGAKILSELI